MTIAPHAQKPQIRIRAYRHGLGDCFLLSFMNGQADVHMLVDFGVLVGTENSADLMNAVMKDIKAATDNCLDIVVATHEHWDHLSGFWQAEAEFKDVKIGDVWLAWTEDPTDPLAGSIRNARQEAVEALSLVASGRGFNASRAVLEFFGELEPRVDGRPRLRRTEEALGRLIKQAAGRVRYLRPGESLAIGALPGVKFYVLGPPRDLAALRRSRTGRGEGYDGKEPTFATSFLGAVRNTAVEGNVEDTGRPFEYDAFAMDADSEEEELLPVEKAKHSRFFQRHYFSLDEPAGFDRTIKSDWLGAAHDIALKLDAHTNNTSLVLAIELQSIAGEPVLLFPGDAQAGNWFSWKDVSFPGESDSRKRATEGHDLLRRTVFYKVGHHGSHNATLSENGLELMSDNLTAIIPVDLAMAARKGWKMPFEPLYTRLFEKCKGRVISTDKGFALEKRTSPLNDAEWALYKARTTVKKLYIDYTISGVDAV